jgi:hypothetical protein
MNNQLITRIAQVLRFDMDNAELYPDSEIRKAGCNDRARRMAQMLSKECENFSRSEFLKDCGVTEDHGANVAGAVAGPKTEYASPYFNDEDQDVWVGRLAKCIGEYTIEPKRDFGSKGYYDSKTRSNLQAGFIVTKNGALALPGAGWTKTVDEAEQAINILMAVGEKGFHGMLGVLRKQKEIEARK